MARRKKPVDELDQLFVIATATIEIIYPVNSRSYEKAKKTALEMMEKGCLPWRWTVKSVDVKGMKVQQRNQPLQSPAGEPVDEIEPSPIPGQGA